MFGALLATGRVNESYAAALRDLWLYDLRKALGRVPTLHISDPPNGLSRWYYDSASVNALLQEATNG